jgi:SET domain
MESLLDQADKLILLAAGGGNGSDAGGGTAVELPDFDIPEELLPFTQPDLQSVLELKESPSKGRGYFARQEIPAGTILVVAKPISMALDDEILGLDDDVDDEQVASEAKETNTITNSSNNAEQRQSMEITDIEGVNTLENGVGDIDDEFDEEDDEDDPGIMEETDNPDEEPEGSTVNELLVLDILQKIIENPSLWSEQITHLYPREEHDIAASPVWISRDDHTFSQFEALIKQLGTIPALQNQSADISKRLPLIVRYNVLSVETCAEMLSYPGLNGHHPLAGAGLYYWPSFFNHDAKPNVSRYAIGDIMWMVTNQDVKAGDELCISYLEHDVLCESAQRRNNMLTLDFQEEIDANNGHRGGGEGFRNNNAGDDDNDEDGPKFPVVDSDVQNEIMGMGDPFAQLDSIDQLMAQATGEALPEGEDDDDEADRMDAHPSKSGPAWFECDIQNLRILKAITLDGMDLSKEAISVWEECVKWTETKMPPNDEASIVMRVQAALCAMHLKEESRARQHAAIALQRHDLMFGGGVRRFRRRYRQDFSLNLRPNRAPGSPSLENLLWPYDD